MVEGFKRTEYNFRIVRDYTSRTIRRLLLLMNIRQRCQTVFRAGYKVGEQSFRSLAAATQLSRM